MPRPQRMLAARVPAHASLGVPYDRIAADSVHAADSVKLGPASADAAVSAVWALRFRDQVISALAGDCAPASAGSFARQCRWMRSALRCASCANEPSSAAAR